MTIHWTLWLEIALACTAWVVVWFAIIKLTR